MFPGDAIFSRTVASVVSSAWRRFTSVFGMGTGGSTSPLSPGNNDIISSGFGFSNR